MIDFCILNNILNSYKRELLSRLLPNGKFEGHEYTALNPRRYDRNLGSFRINIINLIWCDFATGDKGRGFISLYGYIKNVKPTEAARRLANLLNIPPATIEWRESRKLHTEENTIAISSQETLSHSDKELIVKQSHNQIQLSSLRFRQSEFESEAAQALEIREQSRVFRNSFVLTLMNDAVPCAYQPFPAPDTGIKKLISRIWRSATDPTGTVVEKYLQTRGITKEIPPSIRYLADCAHKATTTKWPCMLAAVARWPEQKIIALHRTYLNTDGSNKAPVNPCKMMINKTYGGAVRLSPMAKELIIAEGIETALSLNFLPSKRYSIWAVLTASGYLNLVLPPLPLATSIIIAADNDLTGIKAAKTAAAKWVKEGRKVKIALPPENSDFNDVLMKDIWE